MVIALQDYELPRFLDVALDSVQRYLQKKRVSTQFNDNRPGRKWVENFKRRHPDIRIRTAQNLTQSRAAVTEEDIESWGNRIHTYLRGNGLDSILKEPHRVFNCDETAVILNPKDNRVFAGKGDKTVYQQVNSDEKECLTVLVTANSAGIQAPPLGVFKYERIPDQISMSVPREWGLGKSPESGWMNAALFYEFIVNVFDPWLARHEIERPVILFMDGHASHVALHTSLFCSHSYGPTQPPTTTTYIDGCTYYHPQREFQKNNQVTNKLKSWTLTT